MEPEPTPPEETPSEAEPDETPSDPPEPAVPPDPEPPAVQRLAVPSQQAQAEVTRQLEEVYDFSRDTTAASKIAMAERLLELGKQTEDNPAERFVLLRKAIDLAGEGGDAALMLDAVDAIAAGFEVDALAVRQSVLLKFAKSATDSTTLGSLVESSLPVVDAALAADRYDVALSLIEATYRACQRPQGRDYRKQVYDRRKDIQQLRAVWQEFQAALATLATNPDDAEANLTAGRWYCFRQDDWQQGLPYLAKCSHEHLSAAARRDLAAPTEAAEQIAVADAWWDAAQTAKDEIRATLMRRAGTWYEQAQPNVTSVVIKGKVAQRLEQIAVAGQVIVSGREEEQPQTSGRIRLVPGLFVREYNRHARQSSDVTVFVPEAQLGPPVDVRLDAIVEGKWTLHKERQGVARGYLRIPTKGTYGFTTYGHYTGSSILTVGKTTIEQSRTNNGRTVTFVNLRSGLVPFESIARLGNRLVDIGWQPPGRSKPIPLPAGIVFCNAAWFTDRRPTSTPSETGKAPGTRP